MSVMNKPVTSINPDQASFVMLDVEFFDPPMCCPTGLCGPVLDQELLDLSEALFELKNRGYNVARYQMSSSPQMFLNQPEVMRLINAKQMESLPIVMIRGQVLTSGRYPKLSEMVEHLEGSNNK